MITGVQPKLLVSFDEEGNMTLDQNQSELLGLTENEFNWKLVRESDGLTKYSKDVKWIEFGEDGRYKADYPEIKVGRSLLMSPFNKYFTWQTTEVVEIIEEKPDYIKFKTNNSVYELTKH
jgi:hypothetical protein